MIGKGPGLRTESRKKPKDGAGSIVWRNREVPCMRFFASAMLVAGFMVSAVLPLRAATLSPLQTETYCSDGFTTIDRVDVNSCALPNAITYYSLSPFVSLTAQFSSQAVDPTKGEISEGTALATVQYGFEVVGGSPGDVVPILVATNLSATGSSSSNAFGQAVMGVDNSFGATKATACVSYSLCGTPDTSSSFSGTLAWRATSGDLGNILFLSVAAIGGNSSIPQSGSASADPFIFIDPSFADAADYTIVVAPGVSNAPAETPEPGRVLSGAYCRSPVCAQGEGAPSVRTPNPRSIIGCLAEGQRRPPGPKCGASPWAFAHDDGGWTPV